jgi:hypothetical protein
MTVSVFTATAASASRAAATCAAALGPAFLSALSASSTAPAAGTFAVACSNFSQLSLPSSSKATATLPFASRRVTSRASRAARSTLPCDSDSVSRASSGEAAPGTLTDKPLTSRATSCTLPDRLPPASSARSNAALRSAFPAGASIASRRGRLLTSVVTCTPFSVSRPWLARGLSASSPLVSTLSSAALCADKR